MNTIGASQGQLPAATSATYAPIGRAPVGLESPENKDAALPPVEEPAAAQKARAEQTSPARPTGAAHAARSGNQSSGQLTGPDAGRSAVPGEVSTTSDQSADAPAVALRNAVQLRAAALANPSPQDWQAAAQPSPVAQKKQQDLANLRAAFQAGVASRNRAAGALFAFAQVQSDSTDRSSAIDQFA